MQFQNHRQLKSEDFFKVQASCMRWIGVWPGVVGPNLKHKHVLRAIANSIFMIGVLLCELWSVYNHMGELQIQLEYLCIAGMRVITTVKIIVVIWRRSALEKLLKAIDDIIVNDGATSSKKINHEMWRLESISALGLFILMQVAVTVYVLLPLLTLLVTRENRWQLPLQIDIPFDYQNIFLYPFTYAASSYSLILITTTYIGIDGLIVGCCLYVAAQFHIVRQNISDLFAEEGEQEIYTSEQNEQIKRKFIPIIERHNRCIELTDTMVETFVQMLLTQFFMISVILAMYCISLELARSVHETLLFGNCIAAGCFHIFMFCKSGTILTDASSDIADAAYNTDWHKCDKGVRSMVQLIMVRSQRPCQIRAPFVVASMETFGRILKSTMSFITMLKSFM